MGKKGDDGLEFRLVPLCVFTGLDFGVNDDRRVTETTATGMPTNAFGTVRRCLPSHRIRRF